MAGIEDIGSIGYFIYLKSGFQIFPIGYPNDQLGSYHKYHIIIELSIFYDCPLLIQVG
jgi:hypothetical protein